MTRTLRRLWWHALWKTEERQTALMVGNQLYVSPTTARMLRANLPAHASRELPTVGDFVVVETPYIAQFVCVPRFPRLAALARRLS